MQIPKRVGPGGTGIGGPTTYMPPIFGSSLYGPTRRSWLMGPNLPGLSEGRWNLPEVSYLPLNDPSDDRLRFARSTPPNLPGVDAELDRTAWMQRMSRGSVLVFVGRRPVQKRPVLLERAAALLGL